MSTWKSWKSIAALALALTAPLAGASTIDIAPLAPVTVGQTFSLSVEIAGVTDLFAYQFDLFFDPTVVQVVSEQEGTFLNGGDPNNTIYIPGAIDNVGGMVSFTAEVLNGAVSGVDGGGVLDTFTFQATADPSLGPAVGSFLVGNVLLYDSQLNLQTDSLDLSGAVATVDISPPAPVSVPEPPVGALAAAGLALVLMMRSRRMATTGRPPLDSRV